MNNLTADTSALQQRFDATIADLRILAQDASRAADLHQQILSRVSGDTRWAAHQWWEGLEERLVDVAFEGDVDTDAFGRYAYCPLCGKGARCWRRGYRGFLAGGLCAHLEADCKSIGAVREEFFAWCNARFSETEARQLAAAEAALQARWVTEPLYLTSPGSPPTILQPRTEHDNWRRSPEEVQWAINRLQTLGFSVEHDPANPRITSYVDRQPDYVVYANPISRGAICFSVFPACATAGSRPPEAAFRLQDAWRLKLPEKYRRRVEVALRAWSARL